MALLAPIQPSSCTLGLYYWTGDQRGHDHLLSSLLLLLLMQVAYINPGGCLIYLVG